MPRYAMTVNGEPVEVDVAEKTPLLFVLRNDLGLKGAKLGCGGGHCGVCTVEVNGQAVNACSTPMWDMQGAAVRTVEGCGNDAVLRAFLNRQAAQCGFCIPGIMMTARVMLAADPTVGDDVIIAVLAERHLCRCGAHKRILQAIRDARDAA